MQALDAAKLDRIAAPDPAKPGVFIAALYIPGTQLLVVSAKYSAPPLLVDRITRARTIMSVYVDLQSASVRGTKVFVEDQGADGLAAKPGGDSRPTAGTRETRRWRSTATGRRRRLPRRTIRKAFADADDRYAKMLSTLLAQAKKAEEAGLVEIVDC